MRTHEPERSRPKGADFQVGRGERVKSAPFAKHRFARAERPRAVLEGRESERNGQRKKAVHKERLY